MHNQKEKFVVTTLIILFFLFIGIQFNATEVASSVTPVVEEPGKWDKAGKEVSEAAKAIGEASCESWDKTKDATEKSYEDMKEKSAEAWENTKEGSTELMDKAKSKVHEMSAPTPE